MDWSDAAAAEDVTEDTPFPATVEGRAVGVYLLNGKYYAMEDVCPHADALLSQGFVEGEEIECPLHGARPRSP